MSMATALVLLGPGLEFPTTAEVTTTNHWQKGMVFLSFLSPAVGSCIHGPNSAPFCVTLFVSPHPLLWVGHMTCFV